MKAYVTRTELLGEYRSELNLLYTVLTTGNSRLSERNFQTRNSAFILYAKNLNKTGSYLAFQEVLLILVRGEHPRTATFGEPFEEDIMNLKEYSKPLLYD